MTKIFSERSSPSVSDDKVGVRSKARSSVSRSIKAVAMYEVVKGSLALMAAVALWFWHSDLSNWLSQVVTIWHRYFGQLFIAQVDSLAATALKASDHWRLFIGLIIGYASLRFIEAFGLWTDKIWAYWFSVLGYGIFIPVELYYLIKAPADAFKIGTLLLNIVIVIIVYRNMKQKGLI